MDNLATEKEIPKYNIALVRGGEEIELDIPSATKEMILRIGYLIPMDDRCECGLTKSDEDIKEKLSAVLGSSFNGELAYQTIHQQLISLSDISLLAFQRQDIVDPRIGNKIADYWDIYLDKRFFAEYLGDCSLAYWAERVSEEDMPVLSDDVKDMIVTLVNKNRI